MKRITLWATVAVVLFLTVFVTVRAETRGRHTWCHRWHRPGPVSYLSHELKLSDGQRAQIRTLWQAERPSLAANLHELLAENKEMTTATAGSNSPDEREVQRIADREAVTISKLLIEKERFRSKIYSTVLSPDQRAKADELQKKWESRLDRAADRVGTQSAEN